jgi:prepilin-type N-terminal cleavage/methylation domain-containing protein
MKLIFKLYNKGFALVELLVVIAIIGIMSTIVFVNYSEFNNRFALERSANRLAQESRRVLERSMSAEIPLVDNPSFTGGYGLFFQESERKYIVFIDTNNDGAYLSGTDEILEEINLESMVFIKKVELFGSSSCNQNHKSVVFLSPNPFIFVGGKNLELSLCDEIRVTLSHNLLTNKEKTVIINRVGLIEIDGG